MRVRTAIAAAACAAVAWVAPARAQAPASAGPPPGSAPRVEPVLGTPQSLGNLTILPDGRRIASLQAYFTPQRTLAEVLPNGELVDFPARGEGALPRMAAVLGIRSDTAGVLYVLDNGNNTKAPPKLVVWDARSNRLVRTIDLKAAADTNSQLNDFEFGPDGYVYAIASQLHLSPTFNAGKREPVLPFQMFRFRPLAPGRQGY